MPPFVRSLIAVVVLVAFATLFAHSAIKSIRTGTVKPSRFDRIYRRSADPITFWFHVAVGLVVAAAFLWAAFLSL